MQIHNYTSTHEELYFNNIKPGLGGPQNVFKLFSHSKAAVAIWYQAMSSLNAPY